MVYLGRNLCCLCYVVMWGPTPKSARRPILAAGPSAERLRSVGGRKRRRFIFFNLIRLQRSIEGQLIRGDPRDYIKAKKRKKTAGRAKTAGRELVAMGNPRADNFMLKHEKVFHGGDVLLSVMLLNARRPPALITPQRCQKQHDTAFWAGPHTTFKQRLPLIFDRITWHHCPSRKRRFNCN